MPPLPITPNEFAPGAPPTAIAKIEAIMLWPDNDDRQEAAVHSAFADILQKATREASFSIEESEAEFADFLRDAPRKKDIQCGVDRPFREGLIAGRILMEAVAVGLAGKPVSLQYAKGVITKVNWRGLAKSDKTIQAVWDRYRSVAHLWASYLNLALESRSRDAPYAFPCPQTALPEFLGLSTAYLDAAVCMKPPRATKTLLSSGECWTVPDGIPVQPFALLSGA